MQFTEQELTLAADAAARYLFTARQLPWRRAKAGARWKAMKPAEKYQYRATSGDLVLASLAALPERGVPGQVPTFTGEEIVEAARTGAQTTYERAAPGAWDALGKGKRTRLAGLSLLLTRAAVGALPRRIDPDAAPAVPDFVPDDLV